MMSTRSFTNPIARGSFESEDHSNDLEQNLPAPQSAPLTRNRSIMQSYDQVHMTAERAIEVFRDADANGNDSLDRTEITQVLELLGKESDTAAVDTVMRDACAGAD